MGIIKENKTLVLENKKRCSKCLIIKELSEFYNKKNGLGGVNGICKNCDLERNQVYKRKKMNKYSLAHSFKLSEQHQLRKSGLKRCNMCNKVKGLNEFNKKLHGKKAYCKICQRIKRKEEYVLKEKNLIKGVSSKHLKELNMINMAMYWELTHVGFFSQTNREKEYVENLDDRYIKRILTKNNSLKVSDLTPELIETQRLILKLKREVRNEKHQ